MSVYNISDQYRHYNLNTLGQSIPDNVKSISSIPYDVQGYADIMRQHYKHQPIVATDWPPRIGKHFFGRLAHKTPAHKQNQLGIC